MLNVHPQTLDKEHPHGVKPTFKMNRDPLNRSVLQQHVDFFDDDGAALRAAHIVNDQPRLQECGVRCDGICLTDCGQDT